MKLLLDTNVLLWALSNSTRLKPDVREMMLTANKGTPDDEVLVPDISLVEICIKINIGKLEQSFDDLLRSLSLLGYRRLPITDTALSKLTTLPLIHRDPFDRLIIAQAQEEHALLITGDKLLATYDVKTIIV
jgi:PIN domain nuclease of toxin-antitoxin system